MTRQRRVEALTIGPCPRKTSRTRRTPRSAPRTRSTRSGIEAIAVTQAAYALADRIRPEDPTTARPAAQGGSVTIPAHLAGALRPTTTTARPPGPRHDRARRLWPKFPARRSASPAPNPRPRRSSRAAPASSSGRLLPARGRGQARLLMTSERARPLLYVVIGAAIVIAVAAFWLPRWWENREYRRRRGDRGRRLRRCCPASSRTRASSIDPGFSGGEGDRGARQALVRGPHGRRFLPRDLEVLLRRRNLDGQPDGRLRRRGYRRDFGPPKIRQSRRP